MKLFERTYTETRMAHTHHSKRRTKQQKKISLTRQCHPRNEREKTERTRSKTEEQRVSFIVFGWNDKSRDETRLITLRKSV